MSSSEKAVTDGTQTKTPAAGTVTRQPPPESIRATSDAAALDPEFRKAVIESIISEDNKNRKRDALRRWEIYKDGTLRYVREALMHETTDGAVAVDMMNRAANISIVGTVVDKRARIYKSTVQRTVVSEAAEVSEADKAKAAEKKTALQKVKEGLAKSLGIKPPAPAEPGDAQKQVDALEKYLRADMTMKKANRVLELHKNAMIKLVPNKNDDGTWSLKPYVLHPHQYDVVEDAGDPERARMVILSHYQRSGPPNISLWNGSRPMVGPLLNDWRYGSGKSDQPPIATTPVDEGKVPDDQLRFIWWTASNHFVTDGTGAIIAREDGTTLTDNPIGALPFIPAHLDQDGSFWALGGDDLIDMAILINVLLTDLNFTVKYQGAGLLYAFGNGLPKAIKVGPSRAVIWEYQEGQPKPELGFATSSPAIGEMVQAIETQLNMLLSSNGLETTTITGSLSASRANSGVQELIQRSELVNSIEDNQAIFAPTENQFFSVAVKWANYLNAQGIADDDIADLGQIEEDLEIQVKYQSPEVFATELEKVQTIQARKNLGLNTKAQLILMDNPDLTQDQVEQQIADLNAERVANTPPQLLGVNANGNPTPPTPPSPGPPQPPAPQPTPPPAPQPGQSTPPFKPKP